MTDFWEEEGPVSGDDLIAEIINLYPETVEFLESIGMHCIGCAAAAGETLYEACHVHHLRGPLVLREINRIITG
jgi:hybrid cluster-associated redox disulfide protein